MTLGAAQALRATYIGHEIPVGGVDAIPEGLGALEYAMLFCTVRLPHEAVVNGVYHVVSDWFKGISASEKPLTRSVLMRKL